MTTGRPPPPLKRALAALKIIDRCTDHKQRPDDTVFAQLAEALDDHYGPLPPATTGRPRQPKGNQTMTDTPSPDTLEWLPGVRMYNAYKNEAEADAAANWVRAAFPTSIVTTRPSLIPESSKWWLNAYVGHDEVEEMFPHFAVLTNHVGGVCAGYQRLLAPPQETEFRS